MSTSWPSSRTLAVREALVLDHLGAERGRQRRGVALDDEVEVGAPAAEQQVAHGAADQVDGLRRRPRDGAPARGRRSPAPSARSSIGGRHRSFPTMIASRMDQAERRRRRGERERVGQRRAASPPRRRRRRLAAGDRLRSCCCRRAIDGSRSGRRPATAVPRASRDADRPPGPGPQRDSPAGLEAPHRAGADPRVPRARGAPAERALPRAVRAPRPTSAARWTGWTNTATRR